MCFHSTTTIKTTWRGWTSALEHFNHHNNTIVKITWQGWFHCRRHLVRLSRGSREHGRRSCSSFHLRGDNVRFKSNNGKRVLCKSLRGKGREEAMADEETKWGSWGDSWECDNYFPFSIFFFYIHFVKILQRTKPIPTSLQEPQQARSSMQCFSLNLSSKGLLSRP